ncbi:MAG TPA: GMC oxidoreductase [Rhodopila sp.]|uniref:GMC family oxidoreductase n=1 Tax=Rhodopila sp. TaxID=2480087 RepID=UPI002BF86DB4|nr:GMC oxidoreductase [Rhodopila sp.]HVY14683.1 GMC oxidoreductase [Rhodopila sp.]
MDYDTIIVGGGSAGSVLANRLSARSAHTVLLCEAGQDTPDGKVPPEILDSYPGVAYFDPRFHWTELKVRTQVVSHNDPSRDPPPLRKYEQARVLGGGSSINGQLANRGAPTDYDEWESRGAAGWGWESVLPYFRKLERDVDFDGPLHGKDGRIPIRRIPREAWCGHAHAAAQAFELAGFKYLPDQNGVFQDGYFPITISNFDEKRVSAAAGYLDSSVRARGNLTISTETLVRELVFEDGVCRGVRAMVAGKPATFRAKEVILSTGAIHSPAHLMRAGIGPAGHLRDLGIPVLMNLPGVGQRLMDHPSIALASYLRPRARLDGRTRRHIHVAMRYSSGIPGAPAGDMFVAAASKSAWHAVGEQIASLLVFVNKTYSEAGQVRLASVDPTVEPIVEFNLLSDSRDLERLADGFRRMAAMQVSAPLRAVTTDPFPAAYSDRVRRIGVVNTRNKILTGLISKLLDGPAPLRRYLIENFVVEGDNFTEVMNSEEKLESFIRRATIGVWHASCSCRMGADGDPMAVTDPAGRVRGVGGLRVVDASLFPVVPCANTNIPTLMTAEKIADAILAGA